MKKSDVKSVEVGSRVKWSVEGTVVDKTDDSIMVLWDTSDTPKWVLQKYMKHVKAI